MTTTSDETERNALLRTLPAIDRLLGQPAVTALGADLPHSLLREAAQITVDVLRTRLRDPQAPLPQLDLDAVTGQVVACARALARPSLRRVINVSGTLLHTNLGRAPLCASALAAVDTVARSYSNLEYDMERGERGERFTHIEKLLCRLTGGEAATVVNNNAGAVLLCLAALAGGRSALVSRGEMIEIGGSFRIPEVMTAGGVRLVEVGTTNKTHLKDYRTAIDADTALILKVHTSNYRVVGFTESVAGGELAELARAHGLPVLEDLGSGLLLDLAPFGLPREPTVPEVLKTGVDLVTFSGDKLLGGPQAGLIVGRRDVLDRVRKHPLARALRCDKMTLAALEATLFHYLDPPRALREIPTLAMLTVPANDLRQRCDRLLPQLTAASGDAADLEIVATTATVGGGALPLAELPGWAIAVTPRRISCNQLTARLRAGDPPVIGRVQDNRLLIDPRTLADGEQDDLLAAMGTAFAAVCRP
ncbi:MAG: L-seryl-tRNA(Sec) selenium transferase [Desulfuromonadales bacterium]|nr:L-seryl-tRNA(Sec) selenium transferase [Desulfuromonadales bacterium]